MTVTLADNGTLTFAASDTVTFNAINYDSTTQIVVGSGGLLSASGTTFNATSANNTNGSNATQIVVNSGGHLQASNSTFTIGQLNLAIGTILNAGDLVGNAFNLPLYIPAIDVQYLSGTANNNLSFQNIDIQPDTLTSGQSVALNAIGTQNTTKLLYIFPGNFTVDQWATLTVGPNVPVLIGPGANYVTVTLADNGTLTFATSDTVTFNATNYDSTTQIVVGSGGLLSASGTTFNAASANNSDGSNATQIVVNSGGYLQAGNSSFATGSLSLNNSSNDTLRSDAISGTLAINSGATISISGNDFSNIGTNGVVATGDPNATINLLNNFWGTTEPAQIAAKILDHLKDATRPTVLYNPYLNTLPGSITGLAFNDLNGNGVQDSGEPGEAGVLIYLDLNNSGVFNSLDPNVVTQANNPTGQFAFPGLVPGTYVVREVPPAGSVETDPSASAVATTIYFDGTGAETGITGAGITAFTFQGASFSGGAIFAPGTSALCASGNLAYNASSGNAEVDFSQPISSVSLFYVNGFGFAGGTATAYGADGSVLGTVNSNAATTHDDPNNFVTLGGFAQPIARITFSGGVIDNFTFTTAANNQAYFVRVAGDQTVSRIAFGNHFQLGTTVTAANASATFSTSAQDVSLSATVTSTAGTVNEGTATFTILSGTTVIGSPVTVDVSAGAAERRLRPARRDLGWNVHHRGSVQRHGQFLRRHRLQPHPDHQCRGIRHGGDQRLDDLQHRGSGGDAQRHHHQRRRSRERRHRDFHHP